MDWYDGRIKIEDRRMKIELGIFIAYTIIQRIAEESRFYSLGQPFEILHFVQKDMVIVIPNKQFL